MYVTLMLIAVVLVAALQLIPIIDNLAKAKTWDDKEILVPLSATAVLIWVACHLGWTLAYGWPA